MFIGVSVKICPLNCSQILWLCYVHRVPKIGYSYYIS